MKSKISLISIAFSLLLLPISAKTVGAHHTRAHSILAHHDLNHNNTFNISIAGADGKPFDKSSTKVKAIVGDSPWTSISKEIPAGNVEFIISNRGKYYHELVILKIEKAIDRLPLKGTHLDIAQSGVKIGEIDRSELANGGTHKLMTKLTPGRYLLVSNIPGDYQKGMKALLVVK
jgi:uncharacterized cupredoxin-like copper-binding protein